MSRPMGQYANAQQSGTVMQTSMGQKDPLETVIDRVMMIAQRLVAAENTIKEQASHIEKLELKIENIALKAEGKEFKKPTTTRAKKPTPPTDTTAA